MKSSVRYLINGKPVPVNKPVISKEMIKKEHVTAKLEDKKPRKKEY